MHLNTNKLLVASGLLFGYLVFIKYNKYNKYNKYLHKQEEISVKDKKIQCSKLKNNTTNNVATQTNISFSLNDKFLVKETLVNNENKWYDIIGEVPDK